MMRPNIPKMVTLQKKPEIAPPEAPKAPEVIPEVEMLEVGKPVLVNGTWWKSLFVKVKSVIHRLADKIRQY